MGLRLPRWVNLVLAGVLTGNEFGGWLGWRPALRALPTPAHIQAEQAVTRRSAAIMPVLMTATASPAWGCWRWARSRPSSRPRRRNSAGPAERSLEGDAPLAPRSEEHTS